MRKFPVDIVKIDRSFTSSLGASRTDTIIVSSIMTMMAALGVETIAAGVETREQRSHLIELGARLAQGYYFGKPMAADDFWRLVTAQVDP